MIKVLFVCMGNICRSPMAEAVFQQMVDSAGLGKYFEIDSAGIGAWYVGEPAHDGTLAILRRNNIPYDGRSRQIERTDMDEFDYVLAMDREVMGYLRRYATGTHAELRMFLDYAVAEGAVTTSEVPDPYYDGRFELVYNLVGHGCRALLAHIRKEHNL